MSIWDQEEMQEEEIDNSKSKFLNKALSDGDSIKLHFVDYQKEDQDEGTNFPTEDGKEWVFYFTDESGNERIMKQNSTRGVFFGAMREAKIEPKQNIVVTRHGAGIDTEYDIAIDLDEKVVVNEEVAPF
ncbi:MAG: hypothetical protein NUV65_00845 [Candidatus Roizmanbacteria bacterium]|nr:hypothetical protein [Candidatus Roizmanbacteria bacterium]